MPQLQRRFLAYVREGDTSISADISDSAAGHVERRLSIYYSAYRARLRGSIEVDHAVLATYLGDKLFDGMAAAYIAACPSGFTSLRHFCDRLPGFLANTPPFSEQPVLAELARFERALMDVFDAADADPASREILASIDESRWPAVTFDFHPAVRLFSTTSNCVSIWQALKAGRIPPEAVRTPAGTWLIWRNRERLSEFRSLADDERNMLVAAINSKTFAEVCEALLEAHAHDDLAARAVEALSRWLDDGIVTKIS